MQNTAYTLAGKISGVTAKAGIEPGSAALEADALPLGQQRGLARERSWMDVNSQSSMSSSKHETRETAQISRSHSNKALLQESFSMQSHEWPPGKKL